MRLFSCLLCAKDITDDSPNSKDTPRWRYFCKTCGLIHFTQEAQEDFEGERFSIKDKNAITVTLRNKWEMDGRPTQSSQKLAIEDLHRIVSRFRPLDPIEKMDRTLVNIDKKCNYIGEQLTVDIQNEYPFYYCKEPKELWRILVLLVSEEFITADDPPNPHRGLSISAKGYQRLREIQKPNRDSNQCFVAMWFTPELNKVFESAIKPAIEYKEGGETIPRFRAIKIDNLEHINDINDEIIAQIRRSRFMVCDLTGYRGGVYFEAGFAYGLGLEVIYTCRKDWTKEETLTDNSGNPVSTLFDSNGAQISVKKEGVHFDLAHRNRIEWEPDKLVEFKTKIENRIKAVIV
jgi:hypothetical protein